MKGPHLVAQALGQWKVTVSRVEISMGFQEDPKAVQRHSHALHANSCGLLIGFCSSVAHHLSTIEIFNSPAACR